MSSDYTYLYSTRIQKTFDEDQADILNILRNVISKDKKLTVLLINYYKGLPIIFNAKVVGVDKNSLELDVNGPQAVAIAADYYTFIRSKLFKFDVLAKVQYVNIRRKAVSIRQLCYVSIMADKRNSIRLEIEEPIKAVLMTASETVSGRIIELSFTGALLAVEHISDDVVAEDPIIHIMLPYDEAGTTNKIISPAKLMGIIR